MKLRIRGSSLRLRLTRSEVEKLRTKDGVVEERVRFAPGTTLTYALARGDVASPEASFRDGALRVTAPHALLERWAASDEVGFEAEQPTGDGEVLRILVEKDWSCLTARAGEDDADAYPNPNDTC